MVIYLSICGTAFYTFTDTILKTLTFYENFFNVSYQLLYLPGLNLDQLLKKG